MKLIQVVKEQWGDLDHICNGGLPSERYIDNMRYENVRSLVGITVFFAYYLAHPVKMHRELK